MFRVATVVPVGGDPALYRADGLASAGVCPFGMLTLLLPYRRMERRA